jgi:aerobic-type carbon monoxide dehydrogenase small subunit (CoxS/CutS family)
MQVSITVNGQQRTDEVEPRLLLAHYLREVCGLKATNIGCDTTSCGACTVIVDGLSVKSCTVLAAAADGARVTTLEGLAGPDGELHPVQAAFIEQDAFQCGYCTPGQICSTVALLEEAKAGRASAVTPDLCRMEGPLSDAEIRERMSGNLCRCGAYANIVPAIAEVAR